MPHPHTSFAPREMTAYFRHRIIVYKDLHYESDNRS